MKQPSKKELLDRIRHLEWAKRIAEEEIYSLKIKLKWCEIIIWACLATIAGIALLEFGL